MLRKLLFIIGCIGVSLIAGCASGSIGKQFDSSKAQNIIIGTTTKENVLSLMGEPYGKTTSSDGISTWSYHFITESATPLLSVYGLGKNERKSKNLTVTFNKSGVVTTCIYNTQSSKGQGMYGALIAEKEGGGEHEQMNCVDVKEPPQ